MKKHQNHILLTCSLVVLQASVFSSQDLSLNLEDVCYAKNTFFFSFSFFKVGIDIAKLDGIIDDLDFTEKLISEQSVFCLPGKVQNNMENILEFS